MNKQVIKETEKWAEKYMEKYDSSHNFKHVMRVKNQAIEIAKSEKLSDKDIFEIILGAITHDIGDHKYTKNINEQETVLNEFFKDKLDEKTRESVVFIACNVSLSKEIAFNLINIEGEYNEENIIRHKKYNENIKLKCVQDADRIDSLGSIGIARYFIYGVINNDSEMEQIIDNLEQRTETLLKYIKTDYAKKIADEKKDIIKLYIDDFRKSI